MWEFMYKHGKVMLLVLVVASLFLASAGSEVVSTTHSPASVASPSAVANPTYNVSFHESGLAKGVLWSVTFLGTRTSTTEFANYTGIADNTTHSFTLSSPTFSSYTYLPNPSSGTVYVHGGNLTVSISYYNQTTSLHVSGYDLNFSVSNFPSVMPGITWSWRASVTGISVAYSTTYSTYSSTNKINYFTGLVNGTYSYSLYPAYGASLSPSTGKVTINGSNTTVASNVSILKTYQFKFYEKGLPSNQEFTVTLQDSPTGGSLYSNVNHTFISQNTYLDFTVVNQTYNYYITEPTGYAASPAEGTITVSGAASNLTVLFSTSAETHLVLFKVTNPPDTTTGVLWHWGVTINGTFYGNSYNSTLQGPSLPSGIYSYVTTWYGIALNPLSGSFEIGNSSITVDLNMVPTWSATFKISNLASSAFGYPSFTLQVYENYLGTGGGTIAGNPFISSAGTAYIPALPNGTYYYSLSPTNAYYTLSPVNGQFTIKGSNVSVNVKATAQPVYSAQFLEKGLVGTSGISWGVVVDNGFFYNDSTSIPSGGLSHVSAPKAYSVQLPQGSYWVQAFVIDSGGNYHFMKPELVNVGSGQNTYTMEFATSTGGTGIHLSSNEIIIIGGAVAAAAAVTLLYLFIRRRGPGT